MFDSPMEHCAVCGGMVTLAQTAAECKRRHDCDKEQACPLRPFFSGVDHGPDPQQKKPPVS